MDTWDHVISVDTRSHSQTAALTQAKVPVDVEPDETWQVSLRGPEICVL